MNRENPKAILSTFATHEGYKDLPLKSLVIYNEGTEMNADKRLYQLFQFKPSWAKVQFEILEDSMLLFFTEGVDPKKLKEGKKYEVRRLFFDEAKSRFDDYGGILGNKTRDITMRNSANKKQIVLTFQVFQP